MSQLIEWQSSHLEDQCTTANPKEALISEIKDIIQTSYDYKQ